MNPRNITNITPQSKLTSFNFKEIWQYRDLLFIFIKRDFTTQYKQTILGPVWFLIQPLLTSLIYILIFNKIAKISTDNAPPILFYLGGLTIWNYFSSTLSSISHTFLKNKDLFAKVYFPRMITPIGITISNLFKFSINFLLFIIFYLYYLFSGYPIDPDITILLLPVYIITISGFALGSGIIIASLTTKYRDLLFLLSFSLQLGMYLTPIIYPISQIPEKYQSYALLNPLAPIVEAFKFSFLGQGLFDWRYIIYSFIFMLMIVLFGSIIFSKVEKNFIDSI